MSYFCPQKRSYLSDNKNEILTWQHYYTSGNTTSLDTILTTQAQVVKIQETGQKIC